MPMYKYVGNKVLTFIENKLIGTKLHASSTPATAPTRVHALRNIPLGRLTYNWHFDTQIIIEFVKKGYRIKEVPIPTYYGDEICHVNGIPYAMHCMWEAVKYASCTAGSGTRAASAGDSSEAAHAPLPRSPRPQEQPPADLEARAGAAT